LHAIQPALLASGPVEAATAMERFESSFTRPAEACNIHLTNGGMAPAGQA
jgi:hypothetical protein